MATVVPIAGPVENPKAGTWPTIAGLIRNAFFRAILPGFERESQQVARTTKGGGESAAPKAILKKE